MGYIKLLFMILEDNPNSQITGYKNWCNMSTEFSIKLGINRWSWFKLNNKINGFTIS
jgi:hypothetical protein